jgi:hypothetical protein
MDPKELESKIHEVRLAAAHNRFSTQKATWLAEICTLAEDSAQNWHFFETAAAEKNRLLQEADSWKAAAIELASFVKPGWDDTDAALERFRQLRDNQPPEMVKCDWCGKMVEAVAEVFCETGFDAIHTPEEGEEWKGEEAAKLAPDSIPPEHRKHMKEQMGLTDDQLDQLLATGEIRDLGGVVCIDCQDASLEDNEP